MGRRAAIATPCGMVLRHRLTAVVVAVVLCAPALAGATTPQAAPMGLIAKMPELKAEVALTATSASDLVDRLWQETGQSATADVQA